MPLRDRLRSPGWRAAEYVLGAIAVGCLGWVTFVYGASTSARREGRAALARAAETSPPPVLLPIRLSVGTSLGELDIPRLGFDGSVAEGDDDGTLRAAIGHLPDTPLPWNNGNAVFAGHRDTHFRPLRNIRIGDRIELRTPYGQFRYQVSDTLIVEPTDVSVLAPSSGRRLTLVTCYPFSYLGHAPQRFIVIAEGDTPVVLNPAEKPTGGGRR